MTSDQYHKRERIRKRAKDFGIPALLIGGTISLLFALVQYAGAKSVDAFNDTYLKSATFNAYVQKEESRRQRDSMIGSFREIEQIRWRFTADSLLRCVLANQRHKGSCE